MASYKDELFSETELASLTAPIQKALTLPQRAFTSTEFHNVEVKKIYQRRWIGVLFEFDVAEPGDVKPFTLCGIPLLAIRGKDQQVRVFHNVVPYDGCLAVMNPAKGLQEVVTPYHGWVYNLEGRLTAIPYWDGTREGNLDAVSEFETDLAPVTCETFLHVVFINLSKDPEPFKDFSAPLIRQFPEYDLENAVPSLDASGNVVCLENRVATNWKTYFENACINVLHENFVHAVYNKSPVHPRVDESGRKTFFEIVDGDLLGLGYIHNDFAETYGATNPDVPHLGKGVAAPEKSSFSVLYPNLYFCNAPQYIEIGLTLPDGPEASTDRRIYLVAATSADDSMMAGAEDTASGFAAAGLEDEAVCVAVQQARHSPVFSQHFYSPFWDELHYEFTQRLVRDLTAE